MSVQLCDLKKQYVACKKEIDKEIAAILNNTSFILGKPVQHFENHLQNFTKTKYAIGCASGTDALVLALRAINIKERDEVITTPFTFISTASSIDRVGAKPVFVDIDPNTFNIDPDQIKKKITKRTKAIIVVHLFGQSADMAAILKIAKKHKLKVIEDNAQSLGAKYKNKLTGTIADVGTLSFFPAKTLGGFGDGGAVITNSKSIAEKVKLLRVHGSAKQYYYKEIGYNSRLDALQAAILNVKLKYLNKFNDSRRKAAAFYNEQLNDIREVTTPFNNKECYHVYGQYVIKAKNRDKLKAFFQKNNIGCSIYYPFPLHLQPCYKYLNYKKGSLPVCEKACKNVFALPIYPEMSLKEQKEVVSCIKTFYKK